MKIVCDTNVLIAALVADGLCRDILKRRLANWEIIVSRPLLEELERTLKEKFDATPSEIPFLKVLQDRATMVRIKPLSHPICRDSDDDKILATAIAGKAEILLTGDKDLLVLKEHIGIRILSPRQFVEWLDG